MKRQHRLYEWKDGKKLELGERSLVMGILNVTPDSFSDGGNGIPTPWPFPMPPI